MTGERRKYPRLIRPLDGKYSGASGGTSCRIADISWGGCYLQTLAKPQPGEKTIITVPVGGGTVEIGATVRHFEPPFGFSVEFDPLSPEQVQALVPLLGAPPPELA